MATKTYADKKNGTSKSTLSMWRSNRRAVEAVDYGGVDRDKLVSAITMATGAGAAIMFGITSDAGAFSICVLHGDEKIKEYFHTVGELNDFLASLCEEFV
jgi:hypothetical protein